MTEDHAIYASEQEVEELREEVRRLRQDHENRENGTGDDPKDHSQDESHQNQRNPKPHPIRKLVLLVLGLALVAAAALWWLHAQKFETTDDAQIDGHINGITARVAGTISAVYVEENQSVRAGQVLADLDPRDFKVSLAFAQSQLAQAQAEKAAEQPNVPVTEVTNRTSIATAAGEVANAQAAVAAAEHNHQAALAKVRESEANSAKAQADVERYRPLAAKDEVPREQFDQVVANATALAATVDANRAAAEAASREVDQSRAQLTEARQRMAEARENAPGRVNIQKATLAARDAGIRTAQAQLDQARLNLSYAQLQAPVNGIVAKRSAEVGQHVSAGQQVMLITQVDDLWVTANFKETQIRRMRPGQSVAARVDALKQDFDGYVESLPASSGAVTSLLPPENATGNFVKVVQRMPVRIRLKPGQAGLDRLRPGMSVEPKVRVE